MGRLDQADFKCYPFNFGGYASFRCNADGSSTITPYSDSSCTTLSGNSETVSSTHCNQAGSTTKQYFTTSCFPPPVYALTGYFKLSVCAATDNYFMYPLGTCTTFPGEGIGGVVYSAHKTMTQIKLEYQSFSLRDCSDVGIFPTPPLTVNQTCTAGSVEEGSVIGTTLPALTKNHRYISFYPDNSCSGNVQQVLHVRDGCAPIPGAYAKFHCQADGSSTVQLFGASDYSCSQTPTGFPFTVQPSACAAVGVVHLNTTCVPK